VGFPVFRVWHGSCFAHHAYILEIMGFIMKNRLVVNFAILMLAMAGALSIGMQAQTTEETPAPSDQPSAPMEMGQGQAPPPPPGQAPPPGQPGQMPSGQPPQMGEEPQPGAPSGEGPAKVDQGVGHISMIHGAVSTQRGDSGTWSAAVLNQPVVNGDKVSTGPGGRAEVQLDYANILRVGSGAQANIANFTNKYVQIQVGQGLANYSVFGESEAEPEIDTPNVAVHPAHQDGVFRIEVRPDGDSIIIVRKGEAQISTPQGIGEVKTGEMATVRGTGADARYKISAAPERDDWDRWNSDRDRMIHDAASWHHTNKYFVGSEDLDANGTWEDAPDYGQIWVPNEPSGWAPYRDGNWVWEPYYGWTWVGYEPWGWAPYHYGRWMWYGGSWAWWPGPVWGAGFYRPFWAPAYVSFFGFGGGLGFGFGWGGWGGFGWLPIGPCDRFFPWWGGYGGRFGVVAYDRFGTLNRFGGVAPLHGGAEFSNVAHINDAHIAGAVSTVGAGRFGAGRVTAVAATHSQLSGAHMMTGNMPVVPTRASLSASGRAADPSTIHSDASEHFAGTHAASRPESFQQQTAHLQQSMQQNHFSPTTAGARSTSLASRGSSSGISAGASAAGRDANSSAANSSATRSAGSQSAESASSHGEAGGSEWKTFSPASHGDETAGRGASTSESSGRGDSGSYWNRTGSSSGYSRTGSSRTTGSSNYVGAYSRPQLNMRQPIVQPRSYGGYHAPSSRGSYSGGSHSAPSSAGHASGGGHSGGGHH
jgi:hypothetical protein